MGLRTLQIRKTEVTICDDKEGVETVDLRGLSVSDLTILLEKQGSQLAMLFGAATSGDSLERGDIKDIISSLIREVPELIGEAIALASDEYDPETVEVAIKLPFPVQVECVAAIMERTFTDESQVKKLVETLTRMLIAATGAAEGMELPSEVLSGLNAAKQVSS